MKKMLIILLITLSGCASLSIVKPDIDVGSKVLIIDLNYGCPKHGIECEVSGIVMKVLPNEYLVNTNMVYSITIRHHIFTLNTFIGALLVKKTNVRLWK